MLMTLPPTLNLAKDWTVKDMRTLKMRIQKANASSIGRIRILEILWKPRPQYVYFTGKDLQVILLHYR